MGSEKWEKNEDRDWDENGIGEERNTVTKHPTSTDDRRTRNETSTDQVRGNTQNGTAIRSKPSPIQSTRHRKYLTRRNKHARTQPRANLSVTPDGALSPYLNKFAERTLICP